MKKRVLLITLRTDIGGGPKSVLMLSRYLCDTFDIYIASPKDPPYYNLYQENKKIKEHYFILHRKFTLGRFIGLMFFVKKNKIDVVNSNGKGAGLYSRLLKLFCPRIKVIHTFRGVSTKDIDSLKSRLNFLYERIFSLLTYKFINVSYGEQKVCIDNSILKKEQSVVVLNGIESIENNKTSDISEWKDKFVVTSLSRFDYPKNMFLGYQIAKKLKEYKDIIFLWIGDGDDKEELEKMALQNKVQIVFTGFKTNVSDYLHISDLYLSTSRWEGLPLSLLEASSVGVPMVATDITGNNEVVDPEVNGFLFDGNDADAGADYILKLYQDKELRAKMSAAAKEIFRKKFSVEIMIKNTAQVFNS